MPVSFSDISPAKFTKLEKPISQGCLFIFLAAIDAKIFLKVAERKSWWTIVYLF